MGAQVPSSDQRIGSALLAFGAGGIGSADYGGGFQTGGFAFLFVDLDGSGNVSHNDVRWTVTGDSERPPGSRVNASDSDVGFVLDALEIRPVRYLDQDGDGARGAEEPLVIDLDGSGNLSDGDHYLAPPQYAGTPHYGGTGAPSGPLTAPRGRIAYLDHDGSGTRTPADTVFWDDTADGTLNSGDVCLSFPPIVHTAPAPEKTGNTTTTKQANTTTTTEPKPTDGPQEPGQFQGQDGTFDGNYVHLVIDAQAGTVTGHRVGEYAVFSKITITCPCSVQVMRDSNDRPSTIFFQGQDVGLVFNDHPRGYMGIRTTGQASVVFSLHPEAAATQQEPRLVLLERGDQRSLLAASRGPDGTTPRATFDERSSTITFQGEGGFFLEDAPEEEPAFKTNREAIQQAVVDGRLAAEVQVLATETGVEAQVLAYDQVEVRVARPQAAEYEIRIDAELQEGRSFVFQFPRSAMPEAESLEVRRSVEQDDGTVRPEVLVLADDYEDALTATPGEDAEYWIEASVDGWQVVANVPHFSVQLFQVLGIPPETAPLFAYAVVFVFLFLGVGAMGLVMGKGHKLHYRAPKRRVLPF